MPHRVVVQAVSQVSLAVIPRLAVAEAIHMKRKTPIALPKGLPKGDLLPLGVGFFCVCCFFTYATVDCLSDPAAQRGICLIPSSYRRVDRVHLVLCVGQVNTHPGAGE